MQKWWSNKADAAAQDAHGAIERLAAAAHRALEGSRPTLGRLEDAAYTAADRAAKLAAPAALWLGETGTAVKAASGRALKDSRDYAGRALKDSRDYAGRALKGSRDYAVQNPVTVVVLGLAAGFLLKKLVYDRVRPGARRMSLNIQRSVDVNVPVRTAYNQWTQFEEFPRFMDGVLEVRQIDDTHLHWRARIAGKVEEWNAVITEQIPDERIAWTSTSGARNAGVVTFHRLDPNTTRVMLQLDYRPAGTIEQIGATMGVVEQRVDHDLSRFKEFVESQGSETGAWRGEVRQKAS